MRFPIHGRIINGKVGQGTPKQLPTPGPVRMAINATKAAARIAEALLKNQAVWQSPANREEHRAICQSNECGYFKARTLGMKVLARCTHPNCGCLKQLKTLLATEKCPVGKF